jgi:hypothetical protein
VDLRTDHAYIVAGERLGSEIRVVRACRARLGSPELLAADLKAAGLDGERDAVIALEPRHVLTGPLPDGKVLPKTYHHSAAAHYSEELRPVVPDGDGRRSVMVVDGDHATIVTTLQSDFDARVARARDLGFTVRAVDAPAFAWLRVAPDGVLVVGEGAMFVARTPGGIIAQHSEDEGYWNFYDAAITRARKDKRFEHDRLPVNAPEGHPIYRQVHEIELEPLQIADRAAPPWALAYGLFLWSIAA